MSSPWLLADFARREPSLPPRLVDLGSWADAKRGAGTQALAFLLAGLGIIQSHSRPHVSNDNPFSESQFKTMKYRPHFQARFSCIEHARAHCQVCFPWYNNEHRHSALGLHTPADVHYGQAGQVQADRATVLAGAYATHLERFVPKPPQPPKLPPVSWINRPGEKAAAAQ